MLLVMAVVVMLEARELEQRDLSCQLLAPTPIDRR